VENNIRKTDHDGPGDDRALALANLIDDDQPIDWESEAVVATSDEERAVLAELRVLAALTRVYRDPDAVGATEVMAPVDPAQAPASWASLTILEQIGRGGFARVYRARDVLGRNVALKLFPITQENAGALSSRVLREGSLLARIEHANVVTVYGVERSNGCDGLWMQFINGRTLEQELQARGPLSGEEAALIGLDLCRALAAVHGSGLVHRDVKAQNVMREERGRTVLMDFGAGAELAGLDRTLEMAGTALYLAPELFDGRAATPASDIYSLGVLLYRLVTQDYPVNGVDRFAIENAHRTGQVKRLRDARPDLSTTFVEAVESALSSDPAKRPQTAGELEAALTRRDGDRSGDNRKSYRDWNMVKIVSALAAMIAIAVAGTLMIKWAGQDLPPAGSSAATTIENPSAASVTAAADPVPYSVKATLYRTRNGAEVPLTAGMNLVSGDQLSMQLESSEPVFAYVINVDDADKIYRLFPLPQHQPDNPLPAAANRLPSNEDNWVVTDEGGREHFVIWVSRTKDVAVDAIMRAIPAASGNNKPRRVALQSSEVETLRSVGGLKPRVPQPAASAGSLSFFYDGARELTSEAEKTSGVWIRRLTVPGPAR